MTKRIISFFQVIWTEKGLHLWQSNDFNIFCAEWFGIIAFPVKTKIAKLNSKHVKILQYKGKKTYNFKVRVAGELPENFADDMERALTKYEIVKISNNLSEM